LGKITFEIFNIFENDTINIFLNIHYYPFLKIDLGKIIFENFNIFENDTINI
jgi:hypothetical protein